MKKTLFSLMTLMLVVGLVGAGALAYFSDTETSTGNSFTAGTLTMVLTGKDNEGNPVSTGPYFTVANMAPGDTETAYLEIKNDGSLDMLFRVYLINVVQQPEEFIDQLILTVTLNPIGYTPVLEGDIYGPLDTVIYPGLPLSGIVGEENALSNLLSAFYGEDGPFSPGYVITYRIDVELDPKTGNDFQGARLTADLQVDATQFAHQDPEKISW